ncbi:MAG: hypothetical protein ACO3P1_04540 [Pseudomonadales bacterium]
MTTRTFPSITPTSMSWELIANTQQFVGISGAIQVAQRAGQRWTVTLEFSTLANNDRAVLQAFVAQVLGLADNFTLSPADYDPRGAFGGTPLVAGGSQTGNSLDIDGCTPSVTNWIRAGDFFQVGNELKMATEDASSDGAGAITVSFVPELRAAPADNAAITTTDPEGVFRFVQPRMGWSSRPPFISSMSLECIEDVLA